MSRKPELVIVARFAAGGALDCHVECPEDEECGRNAEAMRAALALLGIETVAEETAPKPKIPEGVIAPDRQKVGHD